MKFFSKDYYFWILIIFLHIVVVNLISNYALTYYPNTGDEFSVLFQAQVFAQGKLTASAPPFADIFSSHYIGIHNGKWFSQYPPFHSLILLPGILIGKPIVWISLLSGVILFGICTLLKKIFGDEYKLEIALFCLLFSFSPTFLFYSASYYSHISALLVYILFLNCFFLYIEKNELKYLIWFSLLLGLGIGIRPYSFFLLALPTVIYFFIKKERRFSNLLSLIFPFLGVLSLLVYYNFNQTGSWDDIAYLRAGSNSDKLSMQHLNFDSFLRISKMLVDTGEWLFGIKIFGSILLFLSLSYLALDIISKRKNIDKITLFKLISFGSIISIVVGHIFYNFSGGRFGERFFFEVTWMISFSLVLFLKELLAKRKIYFVLCVGFILVFSLIFVFGKSMELKLSSLRRMDVFIKTESPEFHTAVIHILNVPDFDPTFYTRNRPDLSGTIYVLYDDRFFSKFYSHFKDRKHYLYDFNHKDESSKLMSISTEQ